MAGAAASVVRVLVADDHPIYLDGISSAVNAAPDMDLVARCDDGDDALARITELQPDVAVLDMRMPALDALEILTVLSAREIATRVLVLTAFVDGSDVYDLLEAGAGGFLSKDEPRERVCDAVRALARGRAVLGVTAQTQIAAELRNRRRGSLLTQREAEILALLADGHSASQIAERLVLGTSTVKTHLHHVYEKLGVTDRAAAVAEAMRRGFLR
jgi:two-component system nitrate/nitrite response regulator NarL